MEAEGAKGIPESNPIRVQGEEVRGAPEGMHLQDLARGIV